MLYTEQLQMYIDNELPLEQKLLLEAKLASSPELREKLRILKEIDTAILDEDAIQIRAKFANIHRKYSNNKKQASIIPLYRKPWRLAAAAAITLFMGLSGLLWIQNQSVKTITDEQLYSMYFSKGDVSGSTVRGNGSSENNFAKAGLAYYEVGNYEKAINCF